MLWPQLDRGKFGRLTSGDAGLWGRQPCTRTPTFYPCPEALPYTVHKKHKTPSLWVHKTPSPCPSCPAQRDVLRDAGCRDGSSWNPPEGWQQWQQVAQGQHQLCWCHRGPHLPLGPAPGTPQGADACSGGGLFAISGALGAQDPSQRGGLAQGLTSPLPWAAFKRSA